MVAYLRGKNYEEAKKLCEELVENHPQFIEGFYHGAIAELNLGNKEKAAEYLEKINDCRRTYMTTVSQEDIEKLKAELKG